MTMSTEQSLLSINGQKSLHYAYKETRWMTKHCSSCDWTEKTEPIVSITQNLLCRQHRISLYKKTSKSKASSGHAAALLCSQIRVRRNQSNLWSEQRTLNRLFIPFAAANCGISKVDCNVGKACALCSIAINFADSAVGSGKRFIMAVITPCKNDMLEFRAEIAGA